MSTKLFVIDALSNLHAGSGEINYGLIDNLIQRCPLTKWPIINSSGLKGALREGFKGKDYVEKIFGQSPDSQTKLQGKARFFEANILSLPARSNKDPYIMVTCPDIIEDIADRLSTFGCTGKNHSHLFKEFADKTKAILGKGQVVGVGGNLKGKSIADLEIKISEDIQADPLITEVFGKKFAVIPANKFTELCDDNHLPIIARNCLENGESTNLWYEQTLPRRTRLYFIIIDGDEMYDDLVSGIFQIGANATIGYGFCKILDLFKEN